jgi:hypothetical protein
MDRNPRIPARSPPTIVLDVEIDTQEGDIRRIHLLRASALPSAVPSRAFHPFPGMAQITANACCRRLQDASQAHFELNRACRTRMEQTLGVEGYHRVRHGPCKHRRAGALLPRPPRAETSEVSQWLVLCDPSMVRAARHPWITLLVGSDPILIEQTIQSPNEVRDELAGDDHRSDVQLLAERAAVAWLAREYADLVQSHSPTIRTAGQPSQRAAHQWFEVAAKEVATLRRPAPRTVDRPLGIVTADHACSWPTASRTDASPPKNLGRAMG